VPLGQLQVTHWVTRRHGIGIATKNAGLRLLRDIYQAFHLDQCFLFRLVVQATASPNGCQAGDCHVSLRSVNLFITGCTLSTKALVENYSRWSFHVFVQGKCFLMALFGIVSTTATQFYGSGVIDWVGLNELCPDHDLVQHLLARKVHMEMVP
jgi:hypothetical protein